MRVRKFLLYASLALQLALGFGWTFDALGGFDLLYAANVAMPEGWARQLVHSLFSRINAYWFLVAAPASGLGSILAVYLAASDEIQTPNQRGIWAMLICATGLIAGSIYCLLRLVAMRKAGVATSSATA